MRRLSLLATALLAPCVVLAPLPAYADSTVCTTSSPRADARSTDISPRDDEENAALRSLRLDDVHELATGAGVGVAVIDSGVQPGRNLAAREGASFAGRGAIKDGHGTIVAGLIAGRGDATGLAPDADVVSVRVSSSEPETDDAQPGSVSPGAVAAAIEWVVAHPGNIRVINLSLGFDSPHAAIATAVDKAVDAGFVVVAAAGNRPLVDGDTQAEADEEPGSVPDEVLFPATLDNVIAVTGRDASLAMTAESVLTGPEIDVSAPVVGLRSVMLDEIVCDISETASSWAAAEVSGLAALILQREPDLTPAQVKTRIEVTAQGGYRDSALDGHGMIQPHEALTAVLDVAADGSLRDAGDRERLAYQAPRPQAQHDDVEGRDRVLWWGIGAGGLLALAFLLRPLTARRRP